MEKFSDLDLKPQILEALKEMGFETPTPVQSAAIPHIMKKEDIIVRSKTGSGKTAVYGISMLQMIDSDGPGPQGLILSPTRELAVQIGSDLDQMSAHLPHKTVAVYGQHSTNTEIQALKNGVTMVTGTPGRVLDHLRRGSLVVKNIRFLVIDEADRMLDMGFIDQVQAIVRRLPKDRQTMLFSATIPPEVRSICREHMKNPVTVEIESKTMTVDTTRQEYFRVDRNEKCELLCRLLLTERPESCLIFCNTRFAVDRVQNFLTRRGYASQALHGDMPQGQRMRAIEQFKNGDFHILVATDVAARGIHIESLALVVNYDVPNEKDSYVHRIGRTGRAGQIGTAISLVTGNDIMDLYEIENHIGTLIEEVEPPTEEGIRGHQVEVDAWVQAQKVKTPPPAADYAKPAKTGQRRRPRRR